MKEAIFKNLKVIELASVLAGPSVGMFFAELGAEVIKVENKKTGGDVTRKWKLPKEDQDKKTSAYFNCINWGKHSLLLDLKEEADKQIVLDLVKEADVLIANFKSGSAQRLGFDYGALKAINPQLIYANLTAYGEDNDAPGFDVLLQAETGFLYMTGEANGPSVRMPVALIDLMAGHQLKEGILVALLERARTGKGTYVAVSLAKSAIASLANQAANWLNVGHIPQKMGTLHPNIAPYGDIFQTQDQQEIILAVGTEKHFKNLCEILEIPELAIDERFATNGERVKNRDTMVENLSIAFANFKQEDLLTKFKEKKVPAGIIRDMKAVFKMPIAQELILTDKEGNQCVQTVVFDFYKSTN